MPSKVALSFSIETVCFSLSFQKASFDSIQPAPIEGKKPKRSCSAKRSEPLYPKLNSEK